MEDIIREANDGPEHVVFSFDIDVMDPAYTPATGTPEPNGLTPRETFPLIRRLCAERTWSASSSWRSCRIGYPITRPC
jgi:agmatinase